MIVKIAAFVVPLGLDTFAVAIALGLRGLGPLRPALAFALFEALMPLIGIVLGRLVGARFETIAVVTGGVVLLGVAASMIKEIGKEDDEAADLSFSSLRGAMLAGFGISMDELAIGFPMGASGLPVVETLAAIAIQTFLVTFVGIWLGKQMGTLFDARVSRAANYAAAVAFALLGCYLIAQRFIPGLPQT